MLAEMTSEILAMQQTEPMQEISEFVGVDFFAVVLPWLLVFAIVYGVLTQAKTPEDRAPRVVIALVLAFIVTPALVPYVQQLALASVGFIALIAGVLVLIVFTEVTDLRDDDKFFMRHPTFTVFAVVVLSILVFIASGLHEALGIDIPPYIAQNYPLLFFLGFMVIVVWWMVQEE